MRNVPRGLPVVFGTNRVTSKLPVPRGPTTVTSTSLRVAPGKAVEVTSKSAAGASGRPFP
jgi:hypothetical protein